MSALILPPGVEAGVVAPRDPGNVVIDNRTELPDAAIEQGVREFFVESASLAWGHHSTFQTYATGSGSLLARTRFRSPTNVFDEIRLAREIADTDDDVRSTMGQLMSVAYSDGMQNFHEDERTLAVYNEVARNANLDMAFKEMYREYLIAAQVTTVSVFTRTRVDFKPGGTGDVVEERIAAPLIGLLPAEQMRVTGADIFGAGQLAYLPENEKLREWLDELFNPKTTAARRNAMRNEDPVSATLFTDRVEIEEKHSLTSKGEWAYTLNPRMAARVTMPKGSKTYPRPLLTSNFALIEAKRLLNLMDYALLQGGANFIVVAKKGTDAHRASQPELEALGETVQRASRTGVIIGDHRLSFEIITPNLDELLNGDKRRLVGRKLAQALLRIPEGPEGAGSEAMSASLEFLARVVSSDRHDIKRHVEGSLYSEVKTRNARLLKGACTIWHPKIVLSGTNYFTDYVLKLRDRGDIPRKFAVEAGGFDWEAGVAQRKREKAQRIDQTMAPAAVPFSSPNAGPQDNNSGRPTGSGPNNGAPGAGPSRTTRDPARPRTTIVRNQGETVRAWWDEEAEETVRVGEDTYRLLEAYPDREEGRITADERQAFETGEIVGAVFPILVNPAYEAAQVRILRLAPGFSAVVGYRVDDEALVTKALLFRAPDFDPLSSEEMAMRLGLCHTEPPHPELPAAPGEEEHAAALQQERPEAGEVHIHLPEGGTYVEDSEIVRDEETGAILRIKKTIARADA